MGLRYVAGLLLIAMGLSIADWWRGISVLERAGAVVWKPVQKLVGGLLPVRHWSQGFVLGLGWGLMPCGLIYSALAWSATAQDAGAGALLMLLFGIGTLPAMLATSFGAAGVQSLLRRRGLKLLIAVFLIGSGAWSLVMTWQHGGHLDRPVGANAPTMQHAPTDNTAPASHGQH
jgi:sulfite exporter TauE/SafE